MHKANKSYLVCSEPTVILYFNAVSQQCRCKAANQIKLPLMTNVQQLRAHDKHASVGMLSSRTVTWFDHIIIQMAMWVLFIWITNDSGCIVGMMEKASEGSMIESYKTYSRVVNSILRQVLLMFCLNAQIYRITYNFMNCEVIAQSCLR